MARRTFFSFDYRYVSERQQAAEELAEIFIEHIPAELWPRVCRYLRMDKATVTLAAFRKLGKAI